MCDFRKLTVRNKETGDIINNYVGIAPYKEVEIYHIGASGCGYVFFDGDKLISPYSPNDKYEFIFGERDFGTGLLYDVKVIDLF